MHITCGQRGSIVKEEAPSCAAAERKQATQASPLESHAHALNRTPVDSHAHDMRVAR